jgi:beta-mannosidase
MKLITIFTLFSVLTSFSQSKQLTWTFKHPIKNTVIEAGTHGSVQQSLIQTGELPDPFYGLNEEKFAWIEDYTWEFNSQFYLSEEQFLAKNFEIEFPGIDTYAAVYLNDHLLFMAENNFKPYRALMGKYVQSGYNKLRVIFTPAVLYHAERYKNEKFHYPATNDVGKVAIASLVRKPQYQFGWDWALRMNTIGFLKPVIIRYFEKTRIVGKNCTTTVISDSAANLDLQIFVSQPLDEKVMWKSNLFGNVEFTKTINNSYSRSVVLKNPKLWWPRGQGDQDMYTDRWFLVDSNGKTIDSMDVRFGVRKSELIIEPDKWGTSYFVKVNDRAIFCKGGDYIPQDMFPTRVKDADIRKMVETMVDCNFNLVRVWGGGYYPDEVFFDACDEMGIMVWQDLMFACAMYPGDSAFLENVKGEFEYQVPRIASHPSLILFNGNNEVDVAWKNWGFQKKFGIFGDDAIEVQTAYDDLFNKLAPAVISSYTNSPYVHTSPLSNWGKDEYFNHGTMHYWGVWHGKDPIEDFGKKSGRFNAEYGFQSFPEYSTLLTFSNREDWSLDSKVMKQHQKSYVGNGMILKQASRLYGTTKSFEEFVYFSQLTQAKAISIAVAGHRVGMPKCMGTLYWQLNDCWQAPTWSSIDYFGNWKALQYAVKDEYKDVAVLAKIEELGKEEYYLVSDSPKAFLCSVKYSVFDLKGALINSNSVALNIDKDSVVKLASSSLIQPDITKSYVVIFDWNNSNGVQEHRTFTHLALKRKKTPAKEVKYSIENVNTANKTATLVINNTGFLADFWVSSNLTGVRFSENFMNYLPGKHSIDVHYSADKFELADLKFFWR